MTATYPLKHKNLQHTRSKIELLLEIADTVEEAKKAISKGNKQKKK